MNSLTHEQQREREREEEEEEEEEEISHVGTVEQMKICGGSKYLNIQWNRNDKRWCVMAQ